MSPLRLAALCLLVLAPGLSAQVGSTTDIITGKVTAPDGSPVEGAQVTVTSLETQVNRSGRTNAKGTYVVLFPDGGGQYRVVIRKLGFSPLTINVQRQSDEDRLVADGRLGQAVTQLAGVEVRAQRQQPNGADRPTPGSTERTITPDQAARLPIDASDLTALAALAPGVVTIAGTDTTPASFSIAGQRPDQNNLTLDGISFGASSIPQDAVRQTRVITNTYDIARGQFTGGQIASTTRSGTNVIQGSGSFQFRSPTLQWQPSVPGAFGQGYSQQQGSFGIGGPIVKDKLFIFGSGQLNHRVDPLQSLLAADDGTLGRLGASPDSVERFLDALSGFGIEPLVPGIPSDRLNNNATALTRLDWNVSEGHTLTLRGDYRWSGQDATRISALSLPQAGGDQRSTGGGLQATLSSRFGTTFVNELKAYVSGSDQHGDPYVIMPAGRVTISSEIDQGTRSITSVSFGTNGGLPSKSSSTSFEGTNELSWLSPGGGHRVKLGALLNASRSEQVTTSNQFGTFSYNSLADFVNGTPALFTRSLSPTIRRADQVSAAAWFGDTWRQSRALQLTYGLRAEGAPSSPTPTYNPVVDSVFGLRTDRLVTELHVSPRIGFSYTRYPSEPRPTTDGRRDGADTTRGVRGARPGRGGEGRGGGAGGRGGFGGGQGGFGPNAPSFFLRGGIGEYRGRIPTQLYSQARQSTGLPGNERQLVCVGPAVPTPDWDAYLAGGPAAIPTSCDGPSGTPFTSSAPSVTAFAPDFEAPRSWRASLGVTKRVLDRWSLDVDAQYALGIRQNGSVDRNLDATPQFALGAEESRPVFVPAGVIVANTGSVPLAASRIDPRFGRVTELVSDLRSHTAQVTSRLSGFSLRTLRLDLAYTFTRSTELSSQTTAGNPNVREWGPSEFQRRHNIQSTLTWPVIPSLELTMVGRLTSGASYTPMVAGDVNGDGARNDRAFIFDPAATADTAVAAAMQRLLTSAPTAARDCLSKQLGHIAGRASCTDPWLPTFDFQVNYRPDHFGLDRRLTISLVASNPLAGLDQALHGADDLHGWGQPIRSDNTLLYVRGFDAAEKRYVYAVNERFGSTRGTTVAFRQPFQVSVQMRYSYGINQFGGGGARGGAGPVRALPAGGGAGGAPGTGAAAGGPFRLAGRQANPLAQILALKDSLGLDSTQVARLQLLSDSLVKKNDKLGEEVRAEMQKAGNSLDPAGSIAALRPKLDEGRKNLEQALHDAQTVLTPEQWAKVPERIKNPTRGRRPPEGER